MYYYPFRVGKAIARTVRGESPDCLRVLLYHDIPLTDQARFGEQMRWLAQSWRFVSPAEFEAMVTGAEAIRGRNVLLTFDDGFASQLRVAEQVLGPMGIRALFFVVSDLVDISDRGEARRFIAEHVRTGTDLGLLPDHLDNMGWTDLEALLGQGHTVGGHTRTHARLSEVNPADLEGEVVASADALEQRLGVSIEHFAYPFGDLESVNDVALAVARQRFRFVFSGLRGNNACDVSPTALRREAATARDPRPLLGSWLEGAADFHYAKSRARLDAWARSSDRR